jgi:putative transposase
MPSQLVIRSHIPVLCRGKEATICSVLGLDRVQVKFKEGGFETVHPKDLSPAPEENVASRHSNKPLEMLNDKDMIIAEERLESLRPLLAHGHISEAMVQKRAREVGKNQSTLYRWLSAYVNSGYMLSSLVPRDKGVAKGTRKLVPQLEELVQTTISEFYLNQQQPSEQKTYEEVCRRCRNAGLKPPHRNTIRSRISVLSNYNRIKFRLGSRLAGKHLPSRGSFPGADVPLSVVQIDHSKMDIIVVDDINRQPIGRPWITLATDIYSRVVLGFYISLDPPGELATGMCISHCVLPKESWLMKRGLDMAWPCWGLMRALHFDNAREFRGKMVQAACKEYGIELQFRPVRRPHYGGNIERLIGTHAKELHLLPGTTFSNTRQKGEYDSEGKSCFTLNELETWVANYFLGVYHKKYHQGIKTTPLQKWEEGILGTSERPGIGIPNRVTDTLKFRLDFMPAVTRSIQDYGVVINNIHYQHDVLRKWTHAKEEGTKRRRQFTFRIDPRDISTIYFFDPDQREYKDIPYRDLSRPPMSLWEARACEQAIRKEGRSHVDEAEIFRRLDQMHSIQKNAERQTKKVRRQLQSKRQHKGDDHLHSRPTKQSPPTSTPLPELSTPSFEPFDDLEMP